MKDTLSETSTLGYLIPRALKPSAITVMVDNGLNMSFLRIANKCLYGWEGGALRPTVVQLRDRDPSHFKAVIDLRQMLAEEDDVIFSLGDQHVKGVITGFHSWVHRSPIQVLVEGISAYDISYSQIEKWESSLDLDN